MMRNKDKLKSCLYRGVVHHARYQSVEHHFTYSLFMVYLDLSELKQVFAGRWLWSATNRPAIAWFRRRDHLGNPRKPLDQCVREMVQAESGLSPAGPIRLLTQLRYFGYINNPVSYYYCFDKQERLQAVVAEINNTPWGERHCYVIPNRQMNSSAGIEAQHEKQFHVSPFMPMDLQYQWRFTVPAETLLVDIALQQQKNRVFDAQLILERQPMNTGNMLGALARFPCMTASIVGGIYWQALKLWCKKTPYYPHPKEHSSSNRVLGKSRSYSAIET